MSAADKIPAQSPPIPPPLPRRKQRKCISHEMVQTANHLVNQGRKIKEIQQILNLSKNATVNLVRKIEEQGDEFLRNFNPAAQRHTVSTIRDPEIKRKIEIYLDADSSLTQNSILEKLRQDGINTSQPQISRILKTMNYSRKRFVCVGQGRDTESVLNKRRIYCQMMARVPDESVVFLDTVQRMLENYNPETSGYFQEKKHWIEQGEAGSQKMSLLTVSQIMQARNRIKNYVRRTPLEFSPFLSQLSKDSKVYIKCENLQLTGSFKLRGAFNKVCLLKEKNDDIAQKGAVSASTGNHALACTEAMNQLGVPIRVFVPENISTAKLERLKMNNAILTLHGHDCIYAENAARKYSEEKKIPFISPYNDIDVAAGQGTIGIEIFEDLPDVDNVLVPVGGGGLIGGIAAYLKQINPRIKIFGCQPIQSKVMYESIKAGTIIFEESGDTLSDGTSGGIEENSVTFELCRSYVDHWLLVEEDDIARAIYVMLSHHHMMVEGAAGVALGAFMTNADQFAGQKTAIIACGANISMEKLKAIVQME